MAKKETYLTCSNPNIFEGMTSISAIICNCEQNSNNSRKIIRVLFDKTKIQSKSRELSFLRRKASQLGFEINLTTPEEIDKKTTGNTHGGIIAECTSRSICELQAKESGIVSAGVYVMLDGVEDPYNFGYSLRSLYAAGVDGLILPPRNWMEVAGIVAKSSAGTSEMIQMYVAQPEVAIEYFRNHNYKIVCAGIKNSVSMYDADLKKPLFLIVGGEKRGISAKIEKSADVVARIEYGKTFRASLSTASAATIMAYEVYRQNR